MTTVLIVEDEGLVREVVQIELEDAGYDVIIADCADAAIAILEARTDNWAALGCSEHSYRPSMQASAVNMFNQTETLSPTEAFLLFEFSDLPL